MADPTRSRHAGEPITDDDATIAAMLEDCSVPTLLLSMVHMTGDTSILQGPLRPTGIFLNEVQGFMSDEDQAAVRARALEVITAYRDGGCVLPPPPDDATVHEMMRFLVAGEVPEEYVPLLLDEPKAALPVVVIGAGMSGILAGIRLGEAGLPYVVLEKNPRPGGTWYEN